MVRRGAEKAMRESEERFRSLTELSSDWYWEQDEELRFTAMSKSVADSIALPPGLFIGKRRWELDLVGVSDAQIADHKALHAAGRPFQDFAYAHRAESGTTRYLSNSAHAS